MRASDWTRAKRRPPLELPDEARARPTIEALRNMLRFRDDKRGWSAVCGKPIRPGVKATGCYEHTLSTQIWLLVQSKAKWWACGHRTDTPVWKKSMPDVTFENDCAWNQGSARSAVVGTLETAKYVAF